MASPRAPINVPTNNQNNNATSTVGVTDTTTRRGGGKATKYKRVKTAIVHHAY